ncbi:MAG: FAD-binding oxidoreductase [Saprospiraceae bacterium]|nr:FAD-binding oxidoreductase [Saprospiraceae bacterium]
MASDLKDKIAAFLPPHRIKHRLIDRYAYASDASHFYLVPKIVVQPKTIEEVQRLLEFTERENEKLTFRAAGTSFSGQGVTDGILADLSNFWRKVTPEDGGKTVRVEPGVIGAHVNQALKKYGRKMGPDPASINACMMGGILSNNSSGMCCGVANNSYHTLRHLTFVLPNGHSYNTGDQSDFQRFEEEDHEIYQGLLRLKEEVRNNPELSNRIRKKYLQKNTVGYCINAFLDFEHPLDILAHVIIGGEGTLAFIAEAVLNTIPDLPYKMTGMLYFESPAAACNAIFDLKTTGAEALEFMDRASLRSVEEMPGVPDFFKTLSEHASAILCEFQETTETALLEKYENARPIFEKLPLIREPEFTQDADIQALLWKIRKGMYPSVASMRAKGTSTLLEDFTFPVERLGDAVVDIQKLFDKYKYENGIIFGHAKDGNLHFAVSQSFITKEDIAHYEKFNDDLFELVVDKYDGALKGEHSTGRAVSAFVEKEWGPEAYRIMKELKSLVDPERRLNPGIIITEDKLTHIHHLKMMPIVEEEVDRCIECGFCENHCPSRDYTLTPRRRIAIRRAIKRLELSGEHSTKNALLKEYKFDGMETCAVDGMCATSCPVDINTGDLIKRLRRENHSGLQNKVALFLARNFPLLEKTAKYSIRTGLFLNSVFGKNFMNGLTRGLRRLSKNIPAWHDRLLKPVSTGQLLALNNSNGGEHRVLYFSACINRMLGGDLFQSFSSICNKAQIEIKTSKTISTSCCGQIFSSKGYADAHKHTVNQTIEKLYYDSEEGKIPVVLDVTSCTQTLLNCRPYLTYENQEKFDRMRIVDVIDFVADLAIPRLQIAHPKQKIVFHPVCSVHKLGSLSKLKSIGYACARQTEIPVFAGCCGMAGDRGFYYPQLTQAATKREAAEVNSSQFDGYYSTSSTCEIALSEATGKNYESILKLVDEVSG